MKKLMLLSFVLITVSVTFAQSLWINDPQNWRGGQGTIEKSSITYQPQGLFTKVDWEITFSARGLNQFSETDTLEAVYNFTLPEGTVVIDSWLWFGDTILKAVIIDRWSANQIYENIVGRRQDPSVLYKNGITNYELRIFPLAAKETRKVKLTFLMPAMWTVQTVSSRFIAQNLFASKYPTEDFTVHANLSDEWTNPNISGEQNIMFELDSSVNNMSYFHSDIEFNELSHDQNFVVNSPLQTGPYLSYFQYENENYYQLALMPLENINLRAPQKILFLFDYQKENSNISQKELLQKFKENALWLINENDSFNILYHNFELQQVGESWIAGDSLSIVTSVAELGDEPFVSYGNLATLLASGIELAGNEDDIKIILVSNSDKLDNIESANQLIKALIALTDPPIPIYISDFQTKNYQYYGVGNNWFRGNEYFYRNLAKLTGGDYCNSFEVNTFSECLNTIFQSAINEDGMVDIHTSLTNGFCYGRFTKNEENIFSNTPFLEIGKYNGEFPFEIQISGEYAGELFSNKINIPEEDAFENDSLLSQYWKGNEILEMEKSPNSYSIINDIIDKSIENSILSNYTSFLCLEPGMLDQIDELRENTDEDIFPVYSSDVKEKATEINVFPNPFNDQVTIEIESPEIVQSDDIKIEIYDMFGRLVKTYRPDRYIGDSKIKLNWDATNQNGTRVPEGTYLFVFTTGKEKITKKLIVM